MTRPYITYPYKATGGTADRTSPDRFADEVNIYDYIPAGLLASVRAGTITTSVQPYLTAAAIVAVADKKTLRIRSGTYPLATTWALPEGSIAIEMDHGAVIKALDTLPVDSQLIIGGGNFPGQQWSFSIQGGMLDGRLMPPRGTGAPDLLNLNGPAYNKVSVHNVIFRCNDTRGDTHGDSCLFVGGSNHLVITGNQFYGAIDAGVYISADTTETQGENAIVANNYIKNCGTGIISKRQFRRMTILANFIDACGVGIATGEAGTLLPGVSLMVGYNQVHNVTRGIEARVADGAVFMGNCIDDYGVDAAGTPQGDAAIVIAGSDHCVVQGNVITNTTVTPHGNSKAIYIQSRTIDVTTYNSTYNNISLNNVRTAAKGIFEENAAQDFNKYIGNMFESVTTPTTILGAGSVVSL